MLRLFLAALFIGAACAASAQPAGVPVPGPALGGTNGAARSPAHAAGAKAAGPRTITWEELVPKDWDPAKAFKGSDMTAFGDGDPRAIAALKKLREVWDNAPTNTGIVGQSVRIPGFVVPLEEGAAGITEFLLVPYFGACIHSPPPPANQIIHVLPKSPAKGVKSMDAVWISGTLETFKTDSYMGAAGYRIEATAVEPYRERPR